MKKIICFLLVLVCLFACVSCNVKDKIQDTAGDLLGNFGKKSTVEDISETIGASKPTKIVTRSEYVGEDTLTAMYTTLVDRNSGKTQFDFEYQRYADIEDMLPTSIMTVAGSVTYNADGSVTSASGESWTAEEAMGYLAESIHVDASGFSSYELTNGGNSLKAYVPVSESVRIFGTAIDADGDILLEIETNGKYLYSVKVSYTANDTGAAVVISTSYDYALVTLD